VRGHSEPGCKSVTGTNAALQREMSPFMEHATCMQAHTMASAHSMYGFAVTCVVPCCMVTLILQIIYLLIFMYLY